jgi:uncharacterized protein (DUF2336 family)
MAEKIQLAALSVADVARLVQERSTDARTATAAKVAQVFNAGAISDSERAIAHEIVAIMVRDVEVRVRKALSENLKDNPELPRDLALQLAKDVAEVAMPLLESSRVLTDGDLIDIVHSQSNQHRLAIAKRAAVSETVSHALTERGDEKVVATLLDNPGARVAEKSMLKAINRFGPSELVNAALVRRDKLPLAVTERLVALASEKLLEQLMQRHDLPAGTAADLVLQARERAVIGLLGEGPSKSDVNELIAELKRSGRLTPSLILRALSTGDLDFFETAIAALADVPVTNAFKLIHDPGKRGLQAIYEKAAMPEKFFPMVRAAVDVAAELQYDGGPADRARYVERMLARVLTQFEGAIDSEELDWMIGRLGAAQSQSGKKAG